MLYIYITYIPVLEQRLEAEKSETNKEQQRLHSLIAMLETQLSEKQRDIDKVGKNGEEACTHFVVCVCGAGGCKSDDTYFRFRNDGSCARNSHGSRLNKAPLKLRKRRFCKGCRMIETNCSKPRFIVGSIAALTYIPTLC